MSPNWKRFTVGVIVCVVVAFSAVVTEAQYYTAYYAPTAYQSYYAPAYQSYYAAPAYQTYYAPSTYSSYYAPASTYQTYYAPAASPTVAYRTGWYPGYWLDRARAWWNGGTTYVASYPTTYAANYPATYSASYPVSYSASYPVTYSAGYAAAPGCSTCSYGASYAPAPCSTCSAPACSTCSSCQAPSVVQASAVGGPTPDNGTRSLIGGERRPELGPSDNPSAQRSDKPATGNGDTSPAATKDALDRELDKAMGNQGQTWIEPPKLFDTKDKAAQNSPAPVHKAVYRRPAGTPTQEVSVTPITWEKARRDAVGWSSASK